MRITATFGIDGPPESSILDIKFKPQNDGVADSIPQTTRCFQAFLDSNKPQAAVCTPYSGAVSSLGRHLRKCDAICLFALGGLFFRDTERESHVQGLEIRNMPSSSDTEHHSRLRVVGQFLNPVLVADGDGDAPLWLREGRARGRGVHLVDGRKGAKDSNRAYGCMGGQATNWRILPNRDQGWGLPGTGYS